MTLRYIIPATAIALTLGFVATTAQAGNFGPVTMPHLTYPGEFDTSSERAKSKVCLIKRCSKYK